MRHEKGIQSWSGSKTKKPAERTSRPAFILESLGRDLSQRVNYQFPIFCMVIVVVDSAPAVRLYDTQYPALGYRSIL